MRRASVLILVLCTFILLNQASSHILPAISNFFRNALTMDEQKNSTSSELSEDYKKYSYIITTYL
ncbi:unnamed protein product [Spodoptera exigua]|nr:unnamed protein product [Spodoptera exigua]